jgi:DNA polymerase III subunit beta
MKVECAKNQIARSIALLERITGKKLALSVLGKIILEVKNKNFFARATNLEMAVELKIPAKVSQDGLIAVAGPVLEAHLSNLPETDISLETTNESLVVKTSNSSARLTTEAADDFPTFSTEKKAERVRAIIPALDLVAGIKSVSYACSTSDIKPELSSVLMSFRDKELSFVATDSFRLAEKKISSAKMDKGAVSEWSALLPARSAVEIARIFDGHEGEVELFVSGDEMEFRTDKVFATARLVAGNFPPYESIIPKSASSQVVLSRDELVSAVRLATVFADKFSQVSFRLIPEDHLFEVLGKAGDRGEASARVEATTEGLPVDVRLNAKYFLDCLTSIKGGDVTIGFNGGEKAMVVRHSGDRSFLYLLMPLHK